MSPAPLLADPSRPHTRATTVLCRRYVEYPFSLVLKPGDRCIESLILRGAIETRLFLLRDHSHLVGPELAAEGEGAGGGSAAPVHHDAHQPRAIWWGRGNEAYGIVPAVSEHLVRGLCYGVVAWLAARALADARHAMLLRATSTGKDNSEKGVGLALRALGASMGAALGMGAEVARSI